MKRLFKLFFSCSLALTCSQQAHAITPDEYAQEVIRKDLPRSIVWLQKLSHQIPADSVELQDLYNAVLPAPQRNWHSGISVKGSIERILLLLEGAEFFPVVRGASQQYLTAKARVQHVLQAAKDQTDHFKFGEKPEVLYRQWQALDIGDFNSFASELGLVLKETQKLLAIQVHGDSEPVDAADVEMVTNGKEGALAATDPTAKDELDEASELAASSTAADSADQIASTTKSTSDTTTEALPIPSVPTQSVPAPSAQTLSPPTQSALVEPPQSQTARQTTPIPQSIHSTDSRGVAKTDPFDLDRFFAYVETSEAGRIAPECVAARRWSTEQTSRCESDEETGCDRKYARQCKKLH